ncbi:PadR family transcriptional regulator [Pseudoflavonifractor sp. An85]|uniref:PadR family transcriptional regulator n=1 Tax=Pseudoflavonifractor sp. An85 TaxID=1965661 RepID=UPI000B38B8BC|nr:PadR family transcriptional regulator [Pseudoflavonifractor sp. An85]OUN23509.1 PadR family transcriptional regulator [Pseudoflavonifractor sp. An85]
MGTLKYAILGLLEQKPRSGYELSQEFESTLNEFWSAKHSQIYPELRKLTQEGAVEYQVEIVGTALEKKMYSITDKGREEFMQWLDQNRPLPPTPKNELRLQVFFSSCLGPQRRLELLEYQLEEHQKRLEHLRHNQTKFDAIPPKDSPEFGDYLVLMGAIMREENNCQWVRECIRLCQE